MKEKKITRRAVLKCGAALAAAALTGCAARETDAQGDSSAQFATSSAAESAAGPTAEPTHRRQYRAMWDVLYGQGAQKLNVMGGASITF